MYLGLFHLILRGGQHGKSNQPPSHIAPFFRGPPMKKEIGKRLNTLNLQSHYLPFGGGSFYPLRVATDVKTFFDRLRPPRTFTWCGQVFVRCGQPRELDPLDFSIFSWLNDTQLWVKSAGNVTKT